MKELQELELHVAKANLLLSETNWLFHLHADSINDMRDSVDALRCEILNAFFHSNDLKEAIEWFINDQQNENKSLK